MLVSELGLQLSSVPQDLLDSAQRLLDQAAGMGRDHSAVVRGILRPVCGFEQDAAEAVAEAVVAVHSGGLSPLDVAEAVMPAMEYQLVECPAGCGRWPCAETLRAIDTLGLYQ